MDVDRRLERLCERVTLVTRCGDRRRGELCVMSFVALLAGEGHTDHPVGASPLIRDFAIRINDAMPRDTRQRLKPFAARILGTDDGHDEARAEVLRRAVVGEIHPRIRRGWPAEPVPGQPRHPFGLLFARAVRRDVEARAALLLLQIERGTPPSASGSAAGELLAACMRAAATQEQREWCWNEAIGLLDRLCDVGTQPARRDVPGERVARAEECLGRAPPGRVRRLLQGLNGVIQPL